MGSNPSKRKNNNGSISSSKPCNIDAAPSDNVSEAHEQIEQLTSENASLRLQVSELINQQKYAEGNKPVNTTDVTSIQLREQMERIKELKDELYLQQKQSEKLKAKYCAKLKSLRAEMSLHAQEHAARVSEMQLVISQLTREYNTPENQQEQHLTKIGTNLEPSDSKTRLIINLSEKISEQETLIAELESKLSQLMAKSESTSLPLSDKAGIESNVNEKTENPLTTENREMHVQNKSQPESLQRTRPTEHHHDSKNDEELNESDHVGKRWVTADNDYSIRTNSDLTRAISDTNASSRHAGVKAHNNGDIVHRPIDDSSRMKQSVSNNDNIREISASKNRHLRPAGTVITVNVSSVDRSRQDMAEPKLTNNDVGFGLVTNLLPTVVA